MIDPYLELGIPYTATTEEIKSAYRKMAQKYHPDRNPNNKSAIDKFLRIRSAYEFLCDSTKKRNFDNQREKNLWNGINPNTGQTNPFGMSDNNWSTVKNVASFVAESFFTGMEQENEHVDFIEDFIRTSTQQTPRKGLEVKINISPSDLRSLKSMIMNREITKEDVAEECSLVLRKIILSSL